MPKKSPHVAIIGAGVAGLTAAQTLAHHGITTTTFEKSHGVGGRAATRRIYGCVIDHGAQYIKKPVKELLDTVMPGASLLHEAHDIRLPVWIFDVHGQIREGDPVQNAEPKWCWAGGLTTLSKRLATGLDIRLDVEVGRIGRTQEGRRFVLLDAEGVTLNTADAVLITPPAPQIITMLAQSEGDDAYRTIFMRELVQVSYRRCLSLTFAYPRRPDVPWYALVNTDRQHAIAWLGCEHMKPGHAPDDIGLLVVQMAHQFSLDHWDGIQKGTYGQHHAPLPELVLDVHERVRQLLNTDLGHPLWINAQCWRYALPDALADFNRLNETRSGWYFAGDYVAGLGRVHLSIESGWRVANMIHRDLADTKWR
ncbi:MAG: NAD(P)-binding protein [Chloroflexaceae bacterium]|nr:NAD(P)-binding protein [Chloroflexaceae bacterium]